MTDRPPGMRTVSWGTRFGMAARDLVFTHLQSLLSGVRRRLIPHAPIVTIMGILSRLSFAVRSRLSNLVGRVEDPADSLDYSHERLRDELQEVKRGIADLTTQKKRLEMQRRRLEENVEKHNEQAREAVRQDREDLARQALERKQTKMDEIEELEAQIEELEATQDELVDKKETLERRIEQFRTKKEAMKARYEAAEASARVSEAVTGAGENMGDVSRAIERATEQTEEREARAAALDELSEEGVLEDPLEAGDPIETELETGRTDRAIETELETIKAEVGEETGDSEVEDAETNPEDVEAELKELREEES